jgi:3-hydroxyacyl-[acyl-carrier-protein] dehydratase
LLLHDLYIIQSLKESENTIQASVLLKADHAIFKGHFPGQPVLPGVCMMEMISEITGEYFNKDFRISGSPITKFLRMIDPKKNPLIHLEIKYQIRDEAVTLNGRIFFEAETFMKFQLNLVSLHSLK